ncbi:MAG: hypothetical protein ACI857_001209 [Arenicella sp.]|jgi:hypothetical protein
MKKSILLIGLCIGTSFASFAQKEEITAIAQYQGYSQGTYGFIDGNEDFLEFESCEPSILEMYNLKTNEHTDNYFEITYVSNVNEDGDIIWVLKDAVLEEIEEEIEY